MSKESTLCEHYSGGGSGGGGATGGGGSGGTGSLKMVVVVAGWCWQPAAADFMVFSKPLLAAAELTLHLQYF